MRHVPRWLKMVVFDTLGVACIIAAILTGWLPGPGGIPLVIVGLTLLSVHHEWAERYIDLLKKYADRLGDLIFLPNPLLQATYDVIAPLLILGGGGLGIMRDELWVKSISMGVVAAGLFIFFGNRRRYRWVRKQLKRKQ